MNKDLTVRTGIEKLEQAIVAMPESFVGDNECCPLVHTFAPGIYVREITIPADMLLIGKIHRHAHPNFLMEGKVSVITEGGGREDLEAPCHMISPAGTKRIVYAHTKVVWVTLHATDSQDLNEIEEQVIAKDYKDEELNHNQLQVLEEIICHG
jgi:hypothetical protein